MNKTNKINAKENYSTEELENMWKAIELSRHPKRPFCLDYVERIFSNFEELKGDRCYSEDPAIIAGIGTLKSVGKSDKVRSVFFIGHQKGRNTKDKIARNFGMAKPEGYRKAMRIFELAKRFNKPVICFIDTPGAYPGVGAEQRGQAEAIGHCISKMLDCPTSTIAVVLGEGGSGGALAIGVADRLLMLENSTYSVISPESCAAILWGTSSESKRAALALKPRANDVHKLGICDEVILEPKGGAHEDYDKTAETILKKIHVHLKKLDNIENKKRLDKRYTKYRMIDEQILKS